MNNGKCNESRGVDAEFVLPRANFKRRERSAAIGLAASSSPRELFSSYDTEIVKAQDWPASACLNGWRWVILRIPAR